MSPCNHLPLIIVKPGPSQVPMPPFEPVTPLRRDIYITINIMGQAQARQKLNLYMFYYIAIAVIFFM